MPTWAGLWSRDLGGRCPPAAAACTLPCAAGACETRSPGRGHQGPGRTSSLTGGERERRGREGGWEREKEVNCLAIEHKVLRITVV